MNVIMKIAKILIALLLILLIVKCIFSEKTAEDFPESVNQEELGKFLQTWSEYLDSEISNDISQLSLSSEKIPATTVKWLEKRDWNAERFFYVEQRIKAIVRTAQLRDHSQKMIKILQPQSGNPHVNELIEMQKQNFNLEKVTEEEIDLVNDNLGYINEILEGRVKL